MLTVSVKDFGPIIEGTVDLKPLTIFIGPSNAGKSYLAMMIYSLTQSFSAPPSGFGSYYSLFRPRARPPRLYRTRPVRAQVTEPSESVSNSIRQWLQELSASGNRENEISFASLPGEVQAYTNELVDNSLHGVERWLSGELQRCHGKTSELVRRAAGSSQLGITLAQDTPRLKVDIRSLDDDIVIEDVDFDIAETKIEDAPWHFSHQTADERHARGRGDSDRAIVDIADLLLEASWHTLFAGFPGESYYLPAARSGIAQGHKAIASILVRQSSFAALQPLEIPTLSGIITDFISHILTMERGARRRSTSGLEEVVDFLEQHVVQGKIDIEQSTELSYPEISYEPFKGQPSMSKFPFHRTSSMVSELAPVILFLKYLVNPGDLVILEEPESHLHPASQRQMARGIARLVNKGVKVIITTHSDYFIGQLNNLIKLSNASRSKRTKEGYLAEDCLKSDDVGAYLFLMDDDLGGSRVKELPITPEFGIDEQEFAAVSEALYNETVSLQRIRTK